MKYAIVTSGGKQHKVAEGDVLVVDRLPEDMEATYTFPEVLLYVDGDVKVGTPFLSDVVVTGKVLDHTKGEKIKVAKFKAKAKYRRTTGFRAALTKIQIDSISLKGEKKEKESASAKKATARQEKPATQKEEK
jgi:large subunit ribosomal protein L21